MAKHKPLILCVDDESIILDSLSFLFRNSFDDKYSTEFAESADEALELIEELIAEQKEVAVIVSDYLMPGMKGDEFLINAHKLLPNVKKILLTGQADFKAVTNAINSADLYRYISKPWQNEDLILTIQEALKSHNQDILVELQNKQLEEKNKLLEEQNSNLEFKVNERTKELNLTLDTIRRDMQLAKKIQESTLTYQLNPEDGIKICTTYIPMTEVGGDFYNIGKPYEGVYRIFLADATGHGVQAALITMAIKGIYDTIKDNEKDLSKLAMIFNQKFIDKYGSLNTFFTGIILDVHYNEKILRYVSLGHPPCMLVRGKDVEYIEKTGRMIGISKTSEYRVEEKKMQSGDNIYIYTDGIFEQFNAEKEEFSEEALYRYIIEYNSLGPEECIKQILQKVYDFLGDEEKQDDISIIGITV
jgi:serine phosphatase RsbU (regulator of sigma subunit)